MNARRHAIREGIVEDIRYLRDLGYLMEWSEATINRKFIKLSNSTVNFYLIIHKNTACKIYE